MKQINATTDIKDMNKAMISMQREMEKMGMMGEMMEDAFEDFEDNLDDGDKNINAENLINQIEFDLNKKAAEK